MTKPTRSKDWKEWKAKGWKYKKDAPHDKEWKKDRGKLFKKNGNGWWWFTSNMVWVDYKVKSRRDNDKEIN
jgi:hypothetical protein|tara:strand:+ start:4087 stop:4299 length:213 start_codon:yes stop_codon:yes gene_type:complete